MITGRREANEPVEPGQISQINQHINKLLGGDADGGGLLLADTGMAVGSPEESLTGTADMDHVGVDLKMGKSATVRQLGSGITIFYVILYVLLWLHLLHKK